MMYAEDETASSAFLPILLSIKKAITGKIHVGDISPQMS